MSLNLVDSRYGAGPGSTSTTRYETADELLRLQTELNEKDLEIAELREQFSRESRAKDMALREKDQILSVTQNKLDNAVRRIEELEALINSLSSLKAELEVEKDRSNKLAQELHSLQSRLTGEKARVTKVVEEKGARNAELEEKVNELQTLADQWRVWGTKRHEEAKKLKSSAQSLKSRLSSALLELESAEQERDRLKSVEHSLQERLEAVGRAQVDLQSRLDAAEMKLQSTDSVVRKRDSQLAQVRNKEAELERRVYEEQSRAKELSRELESTITKLREKEEEARSAELRLGSTESACRELQGRVSELSSRVDRLRSMANEGSRVAESAEERCQDEARRREEAERKLRDASQRAVDLEQQLAAKDVELSRERARLLQEERTRQVMEHAQTETRLAVAELRNRTTAVSNGDVLPRWHPTAVEQTQQVSALEETVRCSRRLQAQQAEMIERLRAELGAKGQALVEARGKLAALERVLQRSAGPGVAAACIARTAGCSC